jgi:hypothetical protein
MNKVNSKGCNMNLNMLSKNILLASGVVVTLLVSHLAVAADEPAPPPGPYRLYDEAASSAPAANTAPVVEAARKQSIAPVVPAQQNQLSRNAPMRQQQPAWAKPAPMNQASRNHNAPNWELPEVPDWVKQRQQEMNKRTEAAQANQATVQTQMPAMAKKPAWANQQQNWKQPEPPAWVSQQREDAEKRKLDSPKRPDWAQAQEWKQPEPSKWVAKQQAEVEKRSAERSQRANKAQVRDWQKTETPEWVAKQRAETQRYRSGPAKQHSWGQGAQWQRPTQPQQQSQWSSDRKTEVTKRRTAEPGYRGGNSRQGSNWTTAKTPEWVKDQRVAQEKQRAAAFERYEKEQAEASMWRPKNDVMREPPAQQPQVPVNPGFFGAPNNYNNMPGGYYPQATPGYGYDPRRFNPWAAQRPVWNRR